MDLRARAGAILRSSPPCPPGQRLAPSPPAPPLLGHARELGARPLEALLSWHVRHGEVVRLKLGWLTGHVLFHPDHIRYVLQEGARRFTKQTRGFDKLKLVLGQGLLVSEGSFWLRQRRIAQPAFHRNRIAGFGAVMVREAERIAERWDLAAERGATVDVAADMTELTLRVVTETLLGSDPDGADAERIGEAVSWVIEDVDRRIIALLDLPREVPTPRNRTLDRHVALLDEQVYRMIAKRRREGPADDLLSMFLEARDEETGEGMTDLQLRDEVMTMYLAGHETTANALAWTFYLLSTSPMVSRRLAEELETVLGGRSPTVDDVQRLEYTTRVIKESMRLYPPAWLTARSPSDDEVIGGYHIPARSLVFMSPWATHRHPGIWDDPEGFDPDRWSPERQQDLPRFAYFPFGGGPRVCIGNGFAMMELNLVLATLAQRFDPAALSEARIVPSPQITLRAEHLPMRIRRRR